MSANTGMTAEDYLALGKQPNGSFGPHKLMFSKPAAMAVVARLVKNNQVDPKKPVTVTRGKNTMYLLVGYTANGGTHEQEVSWGEFFSRFNRDGKSPYFKTVTNSEMRAAEKLFVTGSHKSSYVPTSAPGAPMKKPTPRTPHTPRRSPALRHAPGAPRKKPSRGRGVGAARTPHTPRRSSAPQHAPGAPKKKPSRGVGAARTPRTPRCSSAPQHAPGAPRKKPSCFTLSTRNFEGLHMLQTVMEIGNMNSTKELSDFADFLNERIKKYQKCDNNRVDGFGQSGAPVPFRGFGTVLQDAAAGVGAARGADVLFGEHSTAASTAASVAASVAASDEYSTYSTFENFQDQIASLESIIRDENILSSGDLAAAKDQLQVLKTQLQDLTGEEDYDEDYDDYDEDYDDYDEDYDDYDEDYSSDDDGTWRRIY
jgi:hypothetical protein